MVLQFIHLEWNPKVLDKSNKTLNPNDLLTCCSHPNHPETPSWWVPPPGEASYTRAGQFKRRSFLGSPHSVLQWAGTAAKPEQLVHTGCILQSFMVNVPVSHPEPRGAGWKTQISFSLPSHLPNAAYSNRPPLLWAWHSFFTHSLCFCLMRYRRRLKLTIELPGMLDSVNLH